MNFRVDVIVVGDSISGHEILDKLATSRPNLKVAFISQTFKSTTTHDYLNVKYFRNKVEYISYRYRLFCCYMENGDNIFGTHLVVASGLNYEPYMVNNKLVPCVYNDANDIPKTAKDQPALVICNQDADGKLAIEVAKKYKQVYLCSKEIDFTKNVSVATAKKLSKIENIAMLPNTSIQKVISNKELLQKVELDNYSEIKCSAIFIKTESKPAIDFIPKKILPREDGYPVVKDNCESELVPGCFVAGNCLKKYTKVMEQRLIESILRDF